MPHVARFPIDRPPKSSSPSSSSRSSSFTSSTSSSSHNSSETPRAPSSAASRSCLPPQARRYLRASRHPASLPAIWRRIIDKHQRLVLLSAADAVAVLASVELLLDDVLTRLLH